MPSKVIYYQFLFCGSLIGTNCEGIDSEELLKVARFFLFLKGKRIKQSYQTHNNKMISLWVTILEVEFLHKSDRQQ